MTQRNTIIFVCEHGAAKSIIAATYFNHLANKRGLNLNAIARGTHPDDELSAATVNGLAGDGLAPGESRPQHLTREDMLSALRMVSFCDLPSKFVEAPAVEEWKDVPLVSQDYEKARDVILEHMHDLLNRLRSPR
jgi:protein-tyrosine-phosphatase